MVGDRWMAADTDGDIDGPVSEEAVADPDRGGPEFTEDTGEIPVIARSDPVQRRISPGNACTMPGDILV